MPPAPTPPAYPANPSEIKLKTSLRQYCSLEQTAPIPDPPRVHKWAINWAAATYRHSVSASHTLGLILTSPLLSLPPFYRLTLGWLGPWQRHQAWISGPPAWSHLIQVIIVCCNYRALSIAPPVPTPVPLLLLHPWNCLRSPACVTVNGPRGPISQGHPTAAPSPPWLGSPSPSIQTSLRPELFTGHLACVTVLQVAMRC